jgi:hypothetical protein
MFSKGVAAIVIAVAVHYSGVVEIPAVATVVDFFSPSPSPPLDLYKLHRLLAEGGTCQTQITVPWSCMQSLL